MSSHNEFIQPKSIEDVAVIVVKYKIGFSYDVDALTILFSDSDYSTNFKYASYHAYTKELILMYFDFNKVDRLEIY